MSHLSFVFRRVGNLSASDFNEEAVGIVCLTPSAIASAKCGGGGYVSNAPRLHNLAGTFCQTFLSQPGKMDIPSRVLNDWTKIQKSLF